MDESLASRIEGLEARVRQLESAANSPALIPADPPPLPPPPAPPPVPPQLTQTESSASVGSEELLKWAGVGLVVLAVVFAVSTAIRRGWIGPELQLLGALVFSLGLIGVGLRLKPDRLPWTHALCVGGVAGLTATFASDLFVDQANSDVSLACIALVTVGAYVLAWRVPSQIVGIATLASASIGWLVVADLDVLVSVSIVWFVALAAVAVGVAIRRDWFELRVLAHGVALAALIGFADVADTSAEQAVEVTAALFVFASLAIVPSIGDLSSAWQQVELRLVMIAPLWIFGLTTLTFDLDSDAAVGTTAAAVAVATMAVTLALWAKIRAAHIVSLLTGASVVASVAFAVLFSTSATILMLATQGIGLLVVERYLSDSRRLLANAWILLGIAALIVYSSVVDGWVDDVPVGDDFIHGATIAVIAASMAVTPSASMRRSVGSVSLVLVLLWLGSVLVHAPQGQAAVSVSWAVIGTGLLAVGASRKVPDLGIGGLVVVGVTVAKLLTVDLQSVDALWRAGLFLLVGLALLRLGFLLPALTGNSEVAAPESKSDLKVS